MTVSVVMRVGVIGVGSMGQNHARIYTEMADLVGVADPDAGLGAAISKRFITEFYPDYHMLLKENLDAVSVCVPTHLHARVSHDVIRAGTALLVEKPIAASVAEAEGIVRAAKKAELTLAAGHIERHNPAVSVVKRALSAGEYGDLVTIASRRVSSFPPRVQDLGVVMDLAVHDIDVMRYLVGSPAESVYALAGQRPNERFEDHANILLRFANGVDGFVEVNWLTPMKVRRLALTCLNKFVEVDYTQQSITVSSGTLGALDAANLYDIPLEHNTQNIQVRKEEPLKLELGDFLNAVKDKRPPLVSGEAAVETLRIAEASIASLREGRIVRFG